jgi:hypothetical protein
MPRSVERVFSVGDILESVLLSNFKPIPLGRSHEIKWDGFRSLALIERDECRLLSRNGNAVGSFRADGSDFKAARRCLVAHPQKPEPILGHIDMYPASAPHSQFPFRLVDRRVCGPQVAEQPQQCCFACDVQVWPPRCPAVFGDGVYPPTFAVLKVDDNAHSRA